MEVSNDELRAWTRDFCDGLKVGAPLLQCLENAEQKQSNERFRLVLREVREIVARGYPLSTVMAIFPDVFDANFVTVVRYGEIYGEVDLVLERYVERPQEMFKPCRVISD